MDDATRLRHRRSAFLPPDHDVATGGTPRMLGKVTSTGSNVGVGKFLLVNPVVALGPEVEGGPGTYAVDTSASVPVYLVQGAPSAGDYLICRFVDHRWVAEKRVSGTTGPIGVGIPGCLCQGTPFELAMTVTYGIGEDASTYANAYRSCTLGYFTSPPGYMPQSAFTGAGYYSTTAWYDDYGFLDYFRLNCYSTQYSLGFGQYGLGIWQSPGQIYIWNLGGNPSVNQCDPFALNVGHPQSGVVFKGKIIITG